MRQKQLRYDISLKKMVPVDYSLVKATFESLRVAVRLQRIDAWFEEAHPTWGQLISEDAAWRGRLEDQHKLPLHDTHSDEEEEEQEPDAPEPLKPDSQRQAMAFAEKERRKHGPFLSEIRAGFLDWRWTHLPSALPGGGAGGLPSPQRHPRAPRARVRGGQAGLQAASEAAAARPRGRCRGSVRARRGPARRAFRGGRVAPCRLWFCCLLWRREDGLSMRFRASSRMFPPSHRL
ncbi:unnamed protein product [Prorocentrum cordatum]|uniref:Uncharacterized protein n=1 Tax=Prorocentrum cordatum TaxID=2364126 RepID=A0ABN9YAW1_9DINO|nr:unnamed protein product [Polarella glacialis]